MLPENNEQPVSIIRKSVEVKDKNIKMQHQKLKTKSRTERKRHLGLINKNFNTNND